MSRFGLQLTGRLLSLVMLLLAVLRIEAASGAEATAPEDLVIDFGDLQLTAWAWGDPADELVVALPGSGAANTRYRDLGPLVAAAGYRFVAVNQRGIKGSSGNLQGLTLHDYADDVVRLIDHFGADRAHLVGWAMGNRIQRMVATDYPERVASVTLLAAGGLVAPTYQPGNLGRLLDETDISTEEKMALARDTLFSDATEDSKVRIFAEELTYWNAARLSQQAANRAVPRDLWWAGGSAPMLVVQGLDDRTAPVGNGRQMKQEYGDRITLVEITGAGHLMGYEKPEETAAAMIRFLKMHAITTQ